jgi:hypothetical protein
MEKDENSEPLSAQGCKERWEPPTVEELDFASTEFGAFNSLAFDGALYQS